MAAPKGNLTGKRSGIYKITSPSGRVYIGQSVDVVARFGKYRAMDCAGQRRLMASLSKHGFGTHTFEVIEEVSGAPEMLERERFWQEHYAAIGPRGLNCKLVTSDSHAGQHSAETRARIALANTGKRHSEAAKEKMRRSKIGRTMPEDQRLAMVGRKLADETKAKMRSRMIGNRHTIGVAPANVRKVVCDRTGAVFTSVKAAAESAGIKRTTLNAMLAGQSPNKSHMRYV